MKCGLLQPVMDEVVVQSKVEFNYRDDEDENEIVSSDEVFLDV